MLSTCARVCSIGAAGTTTTLVPATSTSGQTVRSSTLPARLLLRLCGGPAPVRRLKDELEESGWLVRDSNRPVARRYIWKGGADDREHVTAVREEAFEDR